MSPDEPSSPSEAPVLSYSAPLARRRHRVKHVLAIAFAVIALPIGMLLVILATSSFARSFSEVTTHDKWQRQKDALQAAGCSAILIISGAWYARVGLRGDVKAASDDSVTSP